MLHMYIEKNKKPKTNLCGNPWKCRGATKGIIKFGSQLQMGEKTPYDSWPLKGQANRNQSLSKDLLI